MPLFDLKVAPELKVGGSLGLGLGEVDYWTYGSPFVVPSVSQFAIVAGERTNPLIEIGQAYKVTVSIVDDTGNGRGDLKFMMMGTTYQLDGSPVADTRIITATNQNCRIGEARNDSSSANSVVTISVVKV